MKNGGKGEILIRELASEELHIVRKIRVYLPPSYRETGTRRYPVLYMHDGQNVFSGSGGMFGGSWEVDLAAERLFGDGVIEEIIIVGIDNNAERSDEYCHVAPAKFSAGRMGLRDYEKEKHPKGLQYEHFLIHTVKPYIDKNFRTLADRENTALMGSSLGGLVTYFIGLRNPSVFGKLGIVSPAFHWLDFENLLKLPAYPERIWMDAGEGEAHYIENARRVINDLVRQGMKPGENLAYYQVPGAIHNEKSWRERVHMPLIYLFGSLGSPLSCRLPGRRVFGLKGMSYRQITPELCFANNLRMTALFGEYRVEDESVMRVDPSGAVSPITTGQTKVKFTCDGCTAEEEYRVIEELSDMVEIRLKVLVPKTQETIYVSQCGVHALQREADGTYSHTFTVPRDWGFPITIMRGEKHIAEADVHTGRFKNRVIFATESKKIVFRVEAWMQQ